jgi:hypothetical protein
MNARTRYKPEQIVMLLRQSEVAVAGGKTTPRACREAGMIESRVAFRGSGGG